MEYKVPETTPQTLETVLYLQTTKPNETNNTLQLLLLMVLDHCFSRF